jgi:hypothetical protein
VELTFVCLCQKMSLPSLSSSPAQCVLSLGHSDSGWPKISWGGQTSDNYLVQGWDCMADARKFRTWTVNVLTLFLVMHTSPSFIALHHRLQQSASECIFLAFKSCITDCILQILAFFIFVFIFNDYSKWGKKKLWHCTALHCTVHVFPLTHRRWPSQEGHMSPAWLLFVIISYFLDAPFT